MDKNFYDVDKCCEEIREMINTLDFSYDTIMCAMEKIMDEG